MQKSEKVEILENEIREVVEKIVEGRKLSTSQYVIIFLTTILSMLGAFYLADFP